MATTATLIYDLRSKLSSDDRFNISELATALMVGNSRDTLGIYDPTKQYKQNDKIPYITDDGDLVILSAIEATTGNFDPTKWERYDIIGDASNMVSDYAVLSINEPTLRQNKAWFEIKSISYADAAPYVTP